MDDTLIKYDREEMDAYMQLVACSNETQVKKAMEMASDNNSNNK